MYVCLGELGTYSCVLINAFRPTGVHSSMNIFCLWTLKKKIHRHIWNEGSCSWKCPYVNITEQLLWIWTLNDVHNMPLFGHNCSISYHDRIPKTHLLNTSKVLYPLIRSPKHHITKYPMLNKITWSPCLLATMPILTFYAWLLQQIYRGSKPIKMD